jgi:hypothetical protein
VLLCAEYTVHGQQINAEGKAAIGRNSSRSTLRILGGRESGPASLEEAVATYREALKELNRNAADMPATS